MYFTYSSKTVSNFVDPHPVGARWHNNFDHIGRPQGVVVDLVVLGSYGHDMPIASSYSVHANNHGLVFVGGEKQLRLQFC